MRRVSCVAGATVPGAAAAGSGFGVVVGAAGGLPGELHKVWRARASDDYHVEYGYSCMGYEIPAAMGVKMAVGDAQQVVAIVGDGTYQMLPMEIATIVSEGLKVIIVLLQNQEKKLKLM